MPRVQTIVTKILLILTLLFNTRQCVSSNNNNIILRVRHSNGSMHKVQISGDDTNERSLLELLQDFDILEKNGKKDDQEIMYDNSIIDANQSVGELGLNHGSMIQIRNRSSSSSKNGGKKESRKTSLNKNNEESGSNFIPYPDLAKSQSFTTSLRRTRALKKRSNSNMSYGDLQKLSSLYMHTIETQSKGSIERIYMCRLCAERFATSASSNNNKVALLFGTTSKEPIDPNKLRSPRTSLHSTTDKEETCQVVKVHAIWEPPVSKDANDDNCYNTDVLDYESIKPILKIAQKIGLTVVGWIFAHKSREEKDLPIPFMNSKDVLAATKLQLQNMKYFGCDEGQNFITLSLDCDSGSTEAFQISDVTVQIMSESIIPKDGQDNNDDRYLDTNEPLLINGQESNKLDTVLSIINTAMLSHIGTLSSQAITTSQTSNVTNKKGTKLTSKMKKKITDAIESNNDTLLLNLLSDFRVLYTLRNVLQENEMDELCTCIKKLLSRSTKGNSCGSASTNNGLGLGTNLKLVLQSALST